MIYTQLAILGVCVLGKTALAGGADYQRLPNCARAAFLRAAGHSNCSIADTPCICQTNDLLIQLQDVVPHACVGDDFKKAYDVAYQICPNLKNKLPPENNPSLREHPIAYDGGATTVPAQGKPTEESYWNPYDPDIVVPEKGEETKASVNGPTPAPVPISAQQLHEDGAHAHDDQNIDPPAPYTTPANFAASVTASLGADDFGNTETWRYETSVPTNVPTSKPSGSSGGTEQSTGKAAGLRGGKEAWVAVVAMVVALLFTTV